MYRLFVVILMCGFFAPTAHAECRIPVKGQKFVSVQFPAGQEYCDQEATARAAAEIPDRDGPSLYTLQKTGVCGELARPMWFYSMSPNGTRVQSKDPSDPPRWIYAMCEMRPGVYLNVEKYFIVMHPGL